jgi:thiamine thiazole synthase
MSPPIATGVSPVDITTPVPLSAKLNGVNGLKNSVNGTAQQSQDVLEDYNGNYKFAPIEEAEVSRAMIKRYADSLYLSST